MHHNMNFGMTNNESFNTMLNACQNPRAVYAVLLALAKAGILGKSRKEANP